MDQRIFKRDERFHQLHGAIHVAGKLAGCEKDVFAPAAFHVLHHLGRRPVAIPIIAIQFAPGAEVAHVRTTARILDDVRPVEHVFRRVQQVPARRRHPR